MRTLKLFIIFLCINFIIFKIEIFKLMNVYLLLTIVIFNINILIFNFYININIYIIFMLNDYSPSSPLV